MSRPTGHDDPLARLVGQDVVLDTAGTIVYLGRLAEVTDTLFVLDNADLHDCRDGHDHKEVYVAVAHRDGVAINRHRVMVMRHVVISVSALSDVVTGGGGFAFPNVDRGLDDAECDV